MDNSKHNWLFRPQKSNLSIFHDLMQFKVREILLVATVYDAYILEREGQLLEQIYGEYYQLNISSAPRITSVFSDTDAVESIKKEKFDLVIIVTGIDKNMPVILSRRIKEVTPDIPILLLINNNNQILLYEAMAEKMIDIEKMFLWNGDSSIFLAMIKYIEDSTNARQDTLSGDVRIILVVEDSIRYYSRYLPTLYNVIMREVQRLISGEDIDARYKLLKMRARPKVLLASTYESAVELFEKYRDYLLCVITDMKYSMKGEMDISAGKHLARYIKSEISVPILLQSSDPVNRSFADELDISYIDKNSQNLSKELISFFKQYLGFGNFIFRDRFGKEITQARYLKEFESIMDEIPGESIIYHSDRNDFSTWFMAKGEIKSALKLKKAKTEDFNGPDEIRDFIKDTLMERWLEKKRDSISNFSEPVLNEKSYLMRISNGLVGGKGRGIAFTESLLQKQEFKKMISGINISIPKTIIIGTDEFEYFIDQIDFSSLIKKETDHEKIKKLFKEINLSSFLSQRLKKILNNTTSPLAIRSSGLFEDSLSQPFSGIYDTYYLPNNHPDPEERLSQLETAVKMVYASVFTPLAKSYFDSVNHSIEEEKMAVIIQELVGNSYGDYYYPHISGVAQSYNYYPFSYMKAEDGIGLIAVGLGKTVVDGESSYRFCPKYPKMKIFTIKDMLENSQRNFYALNLGKKDIDLLSGMDATLEKIPVSVSEEHGNLKYCASVYDVNANAVRPGLHIDGPRIIDFSYILQYNHIPLSETISAVLEVMERALGTPVEIEFAVDLNKDSSEKGCFYILQVKPLIRTTDSPLNEQISVEDKDLLLNTKTGMGNGIIKGIQDIVYVVPEMFNNLETSLIAKEISKINREMKENSRKYILIGPGRWGSSDPFLGIPVNWATISEARVIVETSLKNFHVDASLGSHFFHNITSMNIGYFTVPFGSKDSFIDIDYLESIKPFFQTKYLKHVRFPDPVTVVMDGRKSISFITKHSFAASL